ncbi:UDP-forming cellulose synthase catalytic subunit [Belnapia rosea]|uniref:Cellulose synthase catalytic subunit [UDP-forming] n=1 Tax=Belnapia rosea TaxID=938405 RepID=A0A1G6UWE5_9PROT|nr:UDP-forming cellulose synthase catalytic subunit [Belnapia rosea]SDD45593.1 cellulose synthase (UDP-forming) [Belnapia rosea]
MSATVFPAPPSLRHQLLRALLVTLGILGCLIYITLPMQAEQQAVLTTGGIIAFLVLNRFQSRRMGLVLVVMSITITFRYLYWRATDTLEFETIPQIVLGVLLFLAELYAGLLMALSYLQTSWPLDRKPVPLPADPSTWPSIDVYVPSYNESLDLVRPTVLAAMGMDWPRDKLNVYILDDGRRPEFRRFAEECGCGYIIRPDNKGAKAGNINHALRYTKGDFIAIFDCDHAPTRSFLQLTVGWLVRDARIAMVQTPHYFYSPDPFERNLARKRPVPNEGLLFYGAIQPGNDLWNAAFFCGSCAVIRRTALEEVGGVPHITVTEDCHCSLLMQKRGWHTAYIRLPLASGLATERLSLHVGQRMRWARGMMQIMRLEKTIVAEGLGWWQRLCYFMGGFGFLFAIPRLIFLTSPLAFLFFGESVIAASPLGIIAYAGSHMFHAVATTARLNGKHRHSFWSEIYEASLAWQLIPVTFKTLWDPTKGKFNVTDKGGMVEEGYLDLPTVMAMVVLTGLLLVGLVIGIVGIIITDSSTLEFRAYLLNTIWAALCVIPASAAVAVGREREQMRVRARTDAVVPATLKLASGESIQAHTSNISLSGARITLARPLGTADGDRATVAFETCGEVIEVRAEVLRWVDDEVFLRFMVETLADEAAVARVFFGRPDAWLHWDDWPVDKPLRSLANVVLATADAVFRKYRIAFPNKPVQRPAPAGAAAPQPARVSDVVEPRRRPVAAAVTGLLLGLVSFASAALAQPLPSLAPAPGPAARPAFAEPADGVREIRPTLRELGLGGPMQLRGISDLQGVQFGLRADEVVTEARLSVSGGTSPSLIPSLSQIAISLNEQFVGTIPVDPAKQAFGPLEFPLDPLFFSEINRLNFRFSGRYAVECNDPLSGLLWATVSDLSTVTMRIERLPPQRDLARLPEPLFDRRVLRGTLTLPVVLAENAGPTALRAAAIAASWFAVQADYRGATFPVERRAPARGDALVLAVGADGVPGLALPRFEGPTIALVANPADSFGTLLVLGGRTEAEVAAAASALAVGRAALAGEMARVSQPTVAPRQPYDSPRWVATDRPVTLGSLVEKTELQGNGYAPAPIRVPLRTAPDILTWRNGGFPVSLQFRAPPGPVVDISASRLDVSVSETYLRSLPLAPGEMWWPIEAVRRRIFGDPEIRHGSATVPPYLLLGRDELQLRFDLRPLARGDCVATPGDLRASVEPESTIDLSRIHRYARMPNLGFFASAGFPFTRMADLSGTAVLLPERPTATETQVFLDLVGQLAVIVGLPSTGLQVVHGNGLSSVAGRDLLAIGPLGRLPALGTLLKETPVRMEGERLVLALPDALQDVRAVFLGDATRGERNRAAAAIADGGEGMGAIIGAESPLQSGQSIVAITGATQASVAAMAGALRDPVQSRRIQGDVVVMSGGPVTAYRAMPRYETGDPAWWLLPQIWFGNHPERALLLLLAAALAMGGCFYWMLRRRAAMRLRARTPVEKAH